MYDISQVVTQIINHDYLAIIVFLLGLLTVVYLNRKRIIKAWLNVKTRYCINHLGLEQISNIKCPDGLGHYFKIDRLLLRHDGLSLLVYKKYPGKIFCADHIDEWTQMLGQKSFPFKNPLFELDYQIKAVSACFPNIPINGYLFFDHEAEFPKGHPQRVIHPQQIPEELNRTNRHEIDPLIMETWRTFKSMSKSTQ